MSETPNALPISMFVTKQKFQREKIQNYEQRSALIDKIHEIDRAVCFLGATVPNMTKELANDSYDFVELKFSWPSDFNFVIDNSKLYKNVTQAYEPHIISTHICGCSIIIMIRDISPKMVDRESQSQTNDAPNVAFKLPEPSFECETLEASSSGIMSTLKNMIPGLRKSENEPPKKKRKFDDISKSNEEEDEC